jgi:hypothetical protein
VGVLDWLVQHSSSADRRLRTPRSPISPLPKSTIDAGSGVVVSIGVRSNLYENVACAVCVPGSENST